MKSATRAIVLMNLGSPDTTEVKDVRRFLNEFLMDERVIDYPYLFRLLLVKGIITPTRASKSAHAYATVWAPEGSPLIVLTRQLQEALTKALDIPVVTAMRYGNPSPAAALDELQQQYPNVTEAILLPLYPHYAMSSYETATLYAEEAYKRGNYRFNLDVIRAFYNDEAYIRALGKSIEPYLQQPYDHLLFSYHGVPERHIRKGDITHNHCLSNADCCTTPSPAHRQCYRHQCFTTTALVASSLGLTTDRYSVSFQSRLGRSEWLKPYTAAKLQELPALGVKKLLVVCPAFISDCLETLEEIAIAGREIFMNAGGESFTMIPCLNVHPEWLHTIGQWMNAIEKGDTQILKQPAHV